MNPFFKYVNKDKWYKEQPVGEVTIGKFLSEISKIAGLLYIYTNHYVRGTATSCVKSLIKLCFQKIAFVLKHINLERLKYYLENLISKIKAISVTLCVTQCKTTMTLTTTQTQIYLTLNHHPHQRKK